ncbi:MAG: amidohydrolase family protein [Planctomycetota bacterium]
MRPRNERTTLSTRRDFLRRAAACGAAAAVPGCSLLTNSVTDKNFGLIDAHVHVWTSDTTCYPLASGYTKDSMKPPSFPPEELFAHCRPLGVNRIVLIQMSFYGFDNSYMLDAIAEHPGVFSGVAVIDETANPVARMRALAPRGVRGFRIRPASGSNETWLNGEGMKAMWAEAAKSRQQMCALIHPEFLPSIDRMCERHPDTPTVVDHFGRIGLDGKMPKNELDDLCRLARHPNLKVKVSAYYALGKKQVPYHDLKPMFRRVYDTFGPERLMWASDCPFQVVGDHDYASSIELVKSLDFLSESDRDWILRRTAEETYF